MIPVRKHSKYAVRYRDYNPKVQQYNKHICPNQYRSRIEVQTNQHLRIQMNELSWPQRAKDQVHQLVTNHSDQTDIKDMLNWVQTINNTLRFYLDEDIHNLLGVNLSFKDHLTLINMKRHVHAFWKNANIPDEIKNIYLNDRQHALVLFNEQFKFNAYNDDQTSCFISWLNYILKRLTVDDTIIDTPDNVAQRYTIPEKATGYEQVYIYLLLYILRTKNPVIDSFKGTIEPENHDLLPIMKQNDHFWEENLPQANDKQRERIIKQFIYHPQKYQETCDKHNQRLQRKLRKLLQ